MSPLQVKFDYLPSWTHHPCIRAASHYLTIQRIIYLSHLRPGIYEDPPPPNPPSLTRPILACEYLQVVNLFMHCKTNSRPSLRHIWKCILINPLFVRMVCNSFRWHRQGLVCCYRPRGAPTMAPPPLIPAPDPTPADPTSNWSRRTEGLILNPPAATEGVWYSPSKSNRWHFSHAGNVMTFF